MCLTKTVNTLVSQYRVGKKLRVGLISLIAKEFELAYFP